RPNQSIHTSLQEYSCSVKTLTNLSRPFEEFIKHGKTFPSRSEGHVPSIILKKQGGRWDGGRDDSREDEARVFQITLQGGLPSLLSPPTDFAF
ncbi:unnamed protein product, partial [Allacma fusca]